MATRREFLGGALSLGLSRAAMAQGSMSEDLPTLVSAGRIGNRDLGVIWRQQQLRDIVLPARGHGIAASPGSSNIVLTGRRPGLYAALISQNDPTAPPKIVTPAKDHRFSGHSALSADGRIFVTSEFDARSIDGLLVARDTANGKELARLDPGGVEPHDVLFAHGRVIAALGGLHKDGGVAGPVYNPDGVKSSVVEIDPQSGRVLARHRLPAEFSTLSLRHLARTPDEKHILVGMQDQDISRLRPLVAIITVGRGIETLPMPDPKHCDFRGYVGSVAFDSSGEVAGVTSPRGSVAGFWSRESHSWIGGVTIPDICGLTAGARPGEFWATTGLGSVIKLVADRHGVRIEKRLVTAAAFDNHVLRL